MKQKGRKKIPPMRLSLVVVLIIAMGFSLMVLIERQTINQQKTVLENEMEVIVPFVFDGNNILVDSEKLNSWLSTDNQLTIGDQYGIIQYDSLSNDGTIGERDEEMQRMIITKDKKKFSFNKDNKTSSGIMAIYNGNDLVGFIKLSESNQAFLSYLKNVKWIVFSCLFIIVLIVISSYVYFQNENQKRILWIDSVLRKVAKNPNENSDFSETLKGEEQLIQSLKKIINQNQLLQKKDRENKAQLDILFSQAKLGVFILNVDLKIVFSNEVTNNLFDFNEKRKKLHEFQQKKIKQLVDEMVKTKKSVTGKIYLTGKKDDEISVTLYPLQTYPIEYMGIVYEDTDIKRMEQVHSDFISNISHELKTPTTAIIGFAETLLAGAKEDPQTAEAFIQIIEKEGNRLLALIQMILTLLKTKEDVYLTETTMANPVKIIEDEIARFSFDVSKKDLTLHFDSYLTKEVELPTNAFQLIVKNILENAIEYTPEKGLISIYLQEINNEVTLTIEDDGIGISDVDQKRIFERFYRVSQSRQRNTGGSGLGLSIVSHYTHILGGNIKLFSKLEEGTTVIIKIPIH